MNDSDFNSLLEKPVLLFNKDSTSIQEGILKKENEMFFVNSVVFSPDSIYCIWYPQGDNEKAKIVSRNTFI